MKLIGDEEEEEVKPTIEEPREEKPSDSISETAVDSNAEHLIEVEPPQVESHPPFIPKTNAISNILTKKDRKLVFCFEDAPKI